MPMAPKPLKFARRYFPTAGVVKVVTDVLVGKTTGGMAPRKQLYSTAANDDPETMSDTQSNSDGDFSDSGGEEMQRDDGEHESPAYRSASRIPDTGAAQQLLDEFVRTGQATSDIIRHVVGSLASSYARNFLYHILPLDLGSEQMGSEHTRLAWLPLDMEGGDGSKLWAVATLQTTGTMRVWTCGNNLPPSRYNMLIENLAGQGTLVMKTEVQGVNLPKNDRGVWVVAQILCILTHRDTVDIAGLDLWRQYIALVLQCQCPDYAAAMANKFGETHWAPKIQEPEASTKPDTNDAVANVEWYVRQAQEETQRCCQRAMMAQIAIDISRVISELGSAHNSQDQLRQEGTRRKAMEHLQSRLEADRLSYSKEWTAMKNRADIITAGIRRSYEDFKAAAPIGSYQFTDKTDWRVWNQRGS